MQTYTWNGDYPLYRVLDENGVVCGQLPSLSDDKILEMYRWMIITRYFDQRAVNLQRQGRTGTYAPFSGQEAAQIGSFALIEKDDWLFTSYRDLAGLMYYGFPMHQSLFFSMGHPFGGHVPEGMNVLPYQIIIGAQILHAVGTAWASKLKGENRVSVTYFGDGATSQGDFHEALNFASVYKAPVIFFCQNNQWAISVPFQRQMATPTIAQKALAYGMEGIRVDGNDIFAVYNAMKRAVERGRAGEGPTLIEAVTYRLGSHTTADDPTRYRDANELMEWKDKRDPIIRLKKFLENKGIWNESMQKDAEQQAKVLVDEAIAAAESFPKPNPAEVFDYVYSTATPDLVEQKAKFLQHGGRER